MVHPNYLYDVNQALEKLGASHEVMILDVQRAIDLENPEPNEEEDELANRRGIIIKLAVLICY